LKGEKLLRGHRSSFSGIAVKPSGLPAVPLTDKNGNQKTPERSAFSLTNYILLALLIISGNPATGF